MTDRFKDPRSQMQIARFHAHEITAARKHNERNAGNWNIHHQEQWELAHLGIAKLIEDQTDTFVHLPSIPEDAA